MPRDFLTRLLGVAPLEPASDWDEAGRLVEFHGLEGLALARSREEGSAPLPGDLAGAWEPAYRMVGLRTTLLLEAAQRAREALGREGIPSLLFKGAALVADGSYPDPGGRAMDDVDLLVPEADAERAVRVLEGGGLRPVTSWSADRAAWADALTLHDAVTSPGGLLPVDLHWRTEYGRLRFGRGGSLLWEAADPRRGLPAPESHLVVVAEHLLKHLRYRTHLAAFGDLARLARSVGDWDRVEGLLRRSRLRSGIRAVLAVLASELGAPVPSGVTAGASPALALALSPAALAGRIRPVEGRLAGIGWRWRLLGGPGGVVTDLVDAAFPPEPWLRARYGRGGAAAWSRYATDVVRWSVYRGRSPASPHQELFPPRARE